MLREIPLITQIKQQSTLKGSRYEIDTWWYVVTLLTLDRCVDVEVQTVLTLVAQVGQQTAEVLQTAPGHALEGSRLVVDVGQALWTHGSEAVRCLDAWPERPRDRRHEPQHACRRWRVRHSTEHLYWVQVSAVRGDDEPRQLAVLCAHDAARHQALGHQYDDGQPRTQRPHYNTAHHFSRRSVSPPYITLSHPRPVFLSLLLTFLHVWTCNKIQLTITIYRHTFEVVHRGLCTGTPYTTQWSKIQFTTVSFMVFNSHTVYYTCNALTSSCMYKYEQLSHRPFIKENTGSTKHITLINLIFII